MQRSKGHSAGRSIAYEHGCRITVARTGLSYDFRRRTDVAHAEILLPPGADKKYLDPAVLANAIEDRERRCDSQLGYQVILAMPKELTREQMVELMRDAAREFFLERGAAVSIALHPPHGEDGVNWHAHLTGTRRRIEGDRLTEDIQYSGAVRTVGGRRIAPDPNYLGRWWGEYQDRWFAEHGIELAVDPENPVPQRHLGPVRFRTDAAREIAEIDRQAVVVACHEPRALLDGLTRNSPTFSGRDLARLIEKNVRAEAVEFIRRKVLSHPDIIELVDPETGLATGRYTTRQVREREEAILAAARAAEGRWYGDRWTIAAMTAKQHGLSPEQEEATVGCATGRGLTIITGDPGTGKSRTLAAVRDTFDQLDHRVVFLAPTNVVAEAARRDGFEEASTIHSALWRFDHAGEMAPSARPEAWDRQTVVIVDEAAMVDSATLLSLFRRVNEAGARIVLCGDDKQLGSVEAGGMFRELEARYGSWRLEEIRRQEVAWQCIASLSMARGAWLEALRRYQLEGRIGWRDTQDGAVAALVEKWAEDTAARPARSRLVMAATNALVDELNDGCRAVRRARGELGPDEWIETLRGAIPIAVGDRLMITATDKRLGLANGQLGTVLLIEGTTVVMDLEGSVVAVPTERFGGLRHGYASTVHKAQGSTIDETYLLVTGHMRRNAGFVALTRHRHDCHLFVDGAARSVEGLATLVARSELREASVAWATAEESERIQRRALKSDATAAIAHGTDALSRWERMGLDAIHRVIDGQRDIPEALVRDMRERREWMAGREFTVAIEEARRQYDAEIASERAVEPTVEQDAPRPQEDKSRPRTDKPRGGFER